MRKAAQREEQTQLPYTQYLKNATLLKTDPNKKELPASRPEELEHYRSTRIFFYWQRLTHITLEYFSTSKAIFGIFDKHGNLVELNGCEDSLPVFAERGFSPGTVWTLDTVGPNAVTAGLAGGQAMKTVGEDNYNTFLKQYAVSFVPIVINRDAPPYDILDLGGIALFTPLEKSNTNNLALLNSMAHDLVLNIQFATVSNILYERVGDGVLCMDICFHDTPTITYCGKTTFEILELPEEEVRFKPVSDLIDPLPQNKEFWDIIKNQRRVSELHTTLCSRGRRFSCIISSDTYNQEGMLHSAGVIFFITTQKRISAKVSEKMANTAILSFDDIIGESTRMRAVMRKAKLTASTQSNIMIIGESGTGKDVLAQAIHNSSDRRDKPFVAINCGALPRDLIATELFGYEGGAFTGAKKQGNIGKFELANGGTIFLDEIGELPLDLQATLLRAVEQKRFMRIGSTKEIDVDVKIISATNVNLAEMIREKRFRSDLYYRLSTFILELPPLRERGSDIVLLAEHMARRIAARIGSSDTFQMTDEAKELLLSLPWPGNVRELQNTVERMVQLYAGKTITPDLVLDCVSSDIWSENVPAAVSSPVLPVTQPNSNRFYDREDSIHRSAASNPPVFKRRRGALTREEIDEALKACHGNRSQAAEYLGISRKTLYRNLERLHIGNKFAD